MSDDYQDVDEADKLLDRLAELIPAIRCKVEDCDASWVEMVETCALEPLLGEGRLELFRRLVAVEILQRDFDWVSGATERILAGPNSSSER